MARRAQLSFGALAAERERNHLASFFVVSPAYERLRARSKIIVLGNRGAGKTAILSMLASEAHARKQVVVDLAPEDFAYELLSESLAREESGSWSKQGAFAAAWKYLLYLLAMKAVMASIEGLKTGPAKRVYTYLRDHHAGVDRNPIGALLSYLKRLEGVKLGRLEASLKARELHRLYRLEEIDYLLDDLEQLCESRPVLLLIDELDRGWDASQDAVAFVAGLFQAGTSIALRTPHVRVVMALRRELYENIPVLYEDAQKVRDTIEVIQWDECKLFDLICRRIAHFIEAPADWSNDDTWRAVMPETVAGRPSFAHLVDLTLYRPRELIQLCTQIQDLGVEREEEPPFSEQTIRSAEVVYAAERFKDIVAEYRFQYPGLDTVLETFRGRRRHLARDELELHCLSLSVGDIRVGREASAWTREIDSDSLIDVLWRVGFLRVLTVDAASSAADAQTTYVGIHQLGTADVRNTDRFQIHSLFATYLRCP